jgi:hypothetical protein
MSEHKISDFDFEEVATLLRPLRDDLTTEDLRSGLSLMEKAIRYCNYYVVRPDKFPGAADLLEKMQTHKAAIEARLRRQ